MGAGPIFIALGPLGGQGKTDQIKRIAGKYDWDRIAEKTLDVYEKEFRKEFRDTTLNSVL